MLLMAHTVCFSSFEVINKQRFSNFSLSGSPHVRVNWSGLVTRDPQALHITVEQEMCLAVLLSGRLVYRWCVALM